MAWVITLRGVTCTAAKRVARGFSAGRVPKPCNCAIAHAPYSSVAGRSVLFSCGYGRGPSNLRERSHAFVGGAADG